MDAGGRERLDALLVERGLARSRGEAQSLITGGRVRADGKVLVRPGRRLPAGVILEVDQPPRRYASRGGLKLEKAFDTFNLDVKGRDCLDIGASTGGFTDCLLSHGARRVYAVDVGYGLLAWTLRQDPRVVVLDRTNARYLTRDHLRLAAEKGVIVPGSREPGDKVAGEPGDLTSWPSFATCDVSFISLLKVIPAARAVLTPSWQMVLLVKPQFEAGREKVGPRGVVRDRDTHVEVLGRVLDGLTIDGSQVGGLTHSPIRGPEGNIEYLLWLLPPGSPVSRTSGQLDLVVAGAFGEA